MIQSFQVLNREAKGMTKGMAHPGFFYIDANGTVREKFFEGNELDRFTPNSVLGKLAPALMEGVGTDIESTHLRVRLAQSDQVVIPGNRFTLVAEVELPPGVHVYAPDVQGYKPIQLALAESPAFKLDPVAYPPAKILYLKVIRERVPVFEGNFRITQDVTVSRARDFVGSLGADGKMITLGGELRYQACDKRVCYAPTSVPVQWQLKVLPLDRQRSPENIQHK